MPESEYISMQLWGCYHIYTIKNIFIKRGDEMDPLTEKLDVKATRKNVKKHLNCLGKKMFRTGIMDFLSFSNSILAAPNSSGGMLNSSNKIENASEKASKYNLEITDYLEWLLSGINKLEREQKKIILGKYLYKYDNEEFEEELGMTMRTIYKKLSEAEQDLAIILSCEQYN